MIKVKHLLEAVEPDDGKRLWVEPIGLTRDLCEWCAVNRVLPHLGPPKALWEWFVSHPDGYDYFRAIYHESLAKSEHRKALQQLSCLSRYENITLLHQSDDPNRNSAAALHEFLNEIETYCPPEA